MLVQGVFLAAAGCERESKIGFNILAPCSSSHVKSSVSVRGAYGLKSRHFAKARITYSWFEFHLGTIKTQSQQ